MSLQDVAAIGEAVGALAVLVMLIYLAYQFRQTAMLERTAAQRDLLSQARSWIELTITNPDLFPVLQQRRNNVMRGHGVCSFLRSRPSTWNATA